jgi:heat shock protein HtpX
MSRSLARPILATLSLVVAIDLAFVTAFAFLLRPWLSPLRAALGVPVWPAVVVVALGLCIGLQIRYTRRETLAEADARRVSESEYPDLHARVRRLSRQADVHTPAVAVTGSDVPNSFTVGGPRDAVVVVSEGLLSTLPEEELDAVLAHELAHVKNRDAAVMTLASFLPALVSDDYSLFGSTFGAASVFAWLALAAVLYVLAAPAIPAAAFGPTYTAVFVGLLAFSALFGSVVLGVLSAPVLVLARRLSRYREYAADRAGAVICGDPTALASALQRLDAEFEAPPARDHRLTGGGGIRGLCLLPYGFGADDDADDDGVAIEWRSHPPTADRIDRLGDLLAEMET